MSAIQYKGWDIWKWTGWKGNKTLATGMNENCRICGNAIDVGAEIHIDYMHGVEEAHYSCVYPGNPPDRLVAQWLAMKGEIRNERHLYVNVGGPADAEGEYDRGACFAIGDEPLVTELTPESEKEKLQIDGLTRMFRLIDRIEYNSDMAQRGKTE